MSVLNNLHCGKSELKKKMSAEMNIKSFLSTLLQLKYYFI